ncbi:YbaB/EbfC family nucleoid-associated protein [Candidatus Uhrbacteria bacterium]|nr:YbaB/EbfC family nucleoid-associated protein [Candidatus Uhrbacteria bacterium]
MFNKLKQFKDIRERAKSLQSTLSQERTEGSAGWGKVKVIVDGNQRVVSVAIEPDMMQDKQKLEGLVKDATNDAMEKVQKILATKMKDLGGLDLAQEMQSMMKK